MLSDIYKTIYEDWDCMSRPEKARIRARRLAHAPESVSIPIICVLAYDCDECYLKGKCTKLFSITKTIEKRLEP